MDLSLAQNNEHFTIADTAQEPNNPSLLHWLSQESGPMGKARNLALATSIGAVQEGKTYLFTFFFCLKFFIMNLQKRPHGKGQKPAVQLGCMNLPKNVHMYLLKEKKRKILPCPLQLLQNIVSRHFFCLKFSL